jgi:hypothetical protein
MPTVIILPHGVFVNYDIYLPPVIGQFELEGEGLETMGTVVAEHFVVSDKSSSSADNYATVQGVGIGLCLKVGS